MAASITGPLVDVRPRVDFIGGVVKGLPYAVSLNILSCLNLSFTTLAGLCGLNRQWKKVANDPLLSKTAVFRGVAFGSEQWRRCFKNVLSEEEMKQYEYNAKEFASLPPDIGNILKSPCPAFPGKSVIETHMLVWLPAELTLNILGKAAKKYPPNPENGYGKIGEAIAKEHGDKSVSEPVWLLMAKKTLPGSRRAIYPEKQSMVAELAKVSKANYTLCSAIEVTACVFAQYFSSSTHSDPRTYTRLLQSTYTITTDRSEGCTVLVGGYSLAGLNVNYNCCLPRHIGVVVVRRFS